MTIFENYIDLQQQISKLEDLKREVAIACLEEMKKNKQEQIKFETGILSITHRRFWTYTDKVKQLEENVKDAKKAEEELELAKCKTVEILRYLPKKVGDIKSIEE